MVRLPSAATKARFNEMKGFLLLAGGLFVLVSLATFHPDDLAFFSSDPSARTHNLCGVAGAYLSAGIRTLLGLAGYLIPALVFIWAAAAFVGRKSSKRYAQLVGFIGFCVASGALLSILWVQDASARVYRGGLIGLGVGDWLLHYCGFIGALIILLGIGALSFLLATDMLLLPILTVVGMSAWKGANKTWSGLNGSRRFQVKPARPAPDPKNSRASQPPTLSKSTAVAESPEPRFILAPKPKPPAPKAAAPKPERPSTPGNYRLPPLDLLNVPPAPEARQLKEDLQTSAKILQDTLMDFGIEVNCAQVEQGPTITRYELEPAPGVKVTRITGLSDDIALAMKAPSVRIIAPIPGKARIGIEVPNVSVAKVYLREVLESDAYRTNNSKIALAFGKDTAGYPLVADLAAMPHLLIAGTTGSGKTVCVNGLITALLLNATPDEVKFLMVDPKMVEMAVYNGLPHLLAPVQTDPKKVPKALNWVVMEMENRYKLFARLGVRNIQMYHQKFKAKEFPEGEAPPTLPYLLVIIDELADLMLTARTEIETSIARLAQLSRAVGIHMVLATQRPSVDVLTGVIKANFPARISFQVASKVDARTVLDTVGAEKLLGHGDMLFMKPGAAKLIRAQACLVTDPEIERVVSFIRQQGSGSYDESLFEEAAKAPGGVPDDKDLMYDEAVQIIVNSGQASVSLLQRRLRLGYGRAARILDTMEQEGIVGPIRGAKPREVLIKSYKGSSGAPDEDVPVQGDKVSNADDR
ncbi:MAG: DNA translocase FtsK [Candidatus Omnitrophica bacterium]|nr:DNA translocase FtsK [Candidatus Omnitrophota bacterium]